MPFIYRSITSKIDVAPEEIAEVFWKMSSKEQAVFFNWLGDNASMERLSFQLQYVTEEKALTDKARAVMEKIGNYAQPK
jgi:hypothetical protein